MDPIIETTSLTPRLRNKPTEARDAIAVDRIVLRNDLRLYIREAWHVVERDGCVGRCARRMARYIDDSLRVRPLRRSRQQGG
jgi:hypothetical protein